MFERFNVEARKVIARAQQEAQDLGHSHIGTEHLLAAMASLPPEEFTASRTLAELKVDPETVRQHINSIIGANRHQPSGHIPFSSRMKLVLELALKESLNNGNPYIGSGHLLLGLLRQGDGVGARVLSEYTSLEYARLITVQQINQTGVNEDQTKSPARKNRWSDVKITRRGNQHGSHLTIGPMDPLTARDIEQVIRKHLGC